jgi:hypothetical protein
MPGLIQNDALRTEIEADLPRAASFNLSDLRDWEARLLARDDPRKQYRFERQHRNDCQAHSATSSRELCILAETGNVVQLSRAAAYLRCEQYDGGVGRDQGTSMQSGVKMMTRDGCPLESAWPYGPYDPRGFAAQWARHADAAKAQIHTGEVVTAPDFRTCLAIIAVGGAIHFGCPYNPRAWGVTGDSADTALRWSDSGGGHAMAIGWARRKGTEWQLEVFNSHDSGQYPNTRVPGNHFWVTEGWWKSLLQRNRYGAYGFVPSKAVERYYDPTVSVMTGNKRQTS